MSNSEDHFTIVAEPEMPAGLDQAIRDLLCACFPADEAVFSKTRYWHGSAPAYSIIHRSGTDLDGHTAIVIRDIQIGSLTTRIAGVQNMAVHPLARGRQIGPRLIDLAMDEARHRNIPFGLLFCTPGLAEYYGRYGWITQPVTVRMDFNGETDIPIPGKNICMMRKLTGADYPIGHIHLGGADW